MKIVVGLGNPGSRYTGTRHNVGFRVVEGIASELDGVFKPGKKQCEQATVRVKSEKVLLVKPTTYMNASGVCVKAVLSYYRCEASDLIVVCDDVNLPVGRLRIRKSGSDGGNNGLASVIYQLETDEFVRVRLGVAHERMSKMDLADFVLSRFESDEQTVMEKAIAAAVEAVFAINVRGVDIAMNRFNGLVIE